MVWSLNRNLLILAFFLIVVGALSGFYIISFFGILIMIPALSGPTKPPKGQTPQAPQQQRQQPQPPRTIPRSYQRPPTTTAPAPKAGPAAPPPQSMSTMAAPSPAPYQPMLYTPALFPGPLLPSLSTMGGTQQPAMAPAELKREGRDELVEVGTMLAILKLVFG